MKMFFKIAGYVLGGIVLLIAAGLIYFNSKFPDVEKPKNIKVEITPERIKRGEYLANHVTGCIDCHSQRDWTKYAAPLISGSEGKGGQKFGREIGFPGDIYAKNISPASVGNWSDGELIRTITQGVNKDNKALFPLMPYNGFNKLTQEDLYSIVSYIRSLQPIENKIPATDLDFPLNFIVKTMPLKSYNPAPEIDRNDHVKYGKYLVTLASCTDCHTQAEKGEPLPGMYLAGGMAFNLPWGIVRSANITPDEATGIGKWTKEAFVARFKAFDNDSAKNISVGSHDFNTVMPWIFLAGMTEEDLGDIYEYLRTVKPVNNSVIRFTPAAD
jgi:mono/diheme cytochrome c family protein